MNYGVHSRADLGPWTLQAGLFKAMIEVEKSFPELFLNVDRDGMGDRQIVALSSRRIAAVSGEARVSRRFDEGDRRHTLMLNLRGRDRTRRYGGEQSISLGRTRTMRGSQYRSLRSAMGPNPMIIFVS